MKATRRIYEVREPSLSDGAGAEAKVESRTIGRILIDLGKLRERDAFRVFALQRKKGLLFGEAARKLRLVNAADVEYALSIQFNFPYLQRGQGTLSSELIVAHEPQHAHAEAVRDVRTQLVTGWLGPEHKVLAICSPAVGDGRSFLAANLAVSFAQLGEKTLLIDADLRAPRQHRMFAIGNRTGLAQALAGGHGLNGIERISYFDELGILAAGATPPNPLELLSRGELQRLIDEARRQYTVVIVDTPSRERGTDARVIAARSDGVLLLARKDRTRLAELEAMRSTFSRSGVAVVGAVLNSA